MTLQGPGSQRRVALVTGGAARIGRAIVDRLAVEGYSVAIHVRAASAAAYDVADHVVASGGQAAVIEADFADGTAVETVLPQTCEQLGPVTLLVNNASLFERDDITSLEEALWDRHFAVNLRAPAFLIRDMARCLPPSETGSVVNILDQRVWRLTPHFSSYTLSKSALWTATQTFAQALAPRIRVNAIGPGPTLNNVRQSDEDFFKQASRIPLRYSVPPSDIADAVVFLAQAQSVTGQMIAVDGGQHLAWETPDVIGITE